MRKLLSVSLVLLACAFASPAIAQVDVHVGNRGFAARAGHGNGPIRRFFAQRADIRQSVLSAHDFSGQGFFRGFVAKRKAIFQEARSRRQHGRSGSSGSGCQSGECDSSGSVGYGSGYASSSSAADMGQSSAPYYADEPLAFAPGQVEELPAPDPDGTLAPVPDFNPNIDVRIGRDEIKPELIAPGILLRDKEMIRAMISEAMAEVMEGIDAVQARLDGFQDRLDALEGT